MLFMGVAPFFLRERADPSRESLLICCSCSSWLLEYPCSTRHKGVNMPGSRQPLRWAGRITEFVNHGPEVLRIEFLIFLYPPGAAIDKGKIGALAVALMFNFLEIIPAFALVNVHVHVSRAAAFLSEQNRAARSSDAGHFHPVCKSPLHDRFVISGTEIDFKVIIEAIDDVTAFGIRVVGEQTHNAKVVSRAGN